MAKVLCSFGIAYRGNPALAFHTLLALGAEEVDWPTFFASAYLVLGAHQQAQLASGRRGGDALDTLLRQALADYPDFTTAALGGVCWTEFAGRASAPQINNQALANYDSLTDQLTFEPRPGADLVDIRYSAFHKRISRIRSNSGDSCASGGRSTTTFSNPGMSLNGLLQGVG